MDNLTHSLVGWTLGQAGLKTKTRKGLAALILGANMPDIDVFFGWVPWEPLATHRGFTHGIVGVAVMPPLLAGLLWLLDRWQGRRGELKPGAPAMHFGWLVALSYLGTFTHPLLDWQTTYSVQLLSPFSRAWFHTDALFIIDVWVIVGLGLAIWLSKRRERRGGHWHRPAMVALSVLVAYIGANAALSSAAKSAAQRAEPRRFEAAYASPPPALFWRREVAWRSGGILGWREFDPFGAGAAPTVRTATGMDNPLVRRALQGVPTFARWSTMPFAKVERGSCAVVVTFADARYGRTIDANRFRSRVTMPTGAPGC